MNPANSINSTNPLSCPICDSRDIDIFIEIPQIPVYCNVLYKSREEALAAGRADMELGFCRNCGHVYNYAFNPELMDYTLDYENSLHFSGFFQQYAWELASDLVKRYNLYGKDIIEIGCGDGGFLALLCELGKNRGVGFDPSHVPDLDKTGGAKGIRFIRDYFSSTYAHYQADLVCCRHVLEHIRQPRDFVESVYGAVEDHPETVVFFEVPNVLYTLKDLGIWDLIYEHCSYFTPLSLQTVFSRSGFEVLLQVESFHGQFLCIETRPQKEAARLNFADGSITSDVKRYIVEFEDKFHSKVDHWKKVFERMAGKRCKSVVWGAGSKGATFLNIMRDNIPVEFVVDINPRKQRKHVAGTGEQICAPEFLAVYKPEKVIVMNPIYLEEIKTIVGRLGLEPEFLVA